MKVFWLTQNVNQSLSRVINYYFHSRYQNFPENDEGTAGIYNSISGEFTHNIAIEDVAARPPVDYFYFPAMGEWTRTTFRRIRCLRTKAAGPVSKLPIVKYIIVFFLFFSLPFHQIRQMLSMSSKNLIFRKWWNRSRIKWNRLRIFWRFCIIRILARLVIWIRRIFGRNWRRKRSIYCRVRISQFLVKDNMSFTTTHSPTATQKFKTKKCIL